METEDLQGSSQGNPVFWRSWCLGCRCHTHHCPNSWDTNYPLSSRAGQPEARQDRSGHNNSLVSLTIIIHWCLLRMWPACPSLPTETVHWRWGSKRGDPNSHSLFPFPREQAASRIKSHQQGQGHTGADWGATMGLPGRDVAVWGGMLFINTKSTNLSSPSFPFLFTSPLPYQLKSCYSSSLFSQLKITFGCLISLLQTDSFKGRYLCVWQVWPHFLWHLCWQHIPTTDTHNCSWASPRTLQTKETKLFFLLYEDFHCDLSSKYKLWSQWILYSQNVLVSQSVQVQKVGKSLNFSQKLKWK